VQIDESAWRPRHRKPLHGKPGVFQAARADVATITADQIRRVVKDVTPGLTRGQGNARRSYGVVKKGGLFWSLSPRRLREAWIAGAICS